MKNILNIVHSLSEGGAEKLTATLSQKLSINNNVHIMLDDINKVSYQYGGKLFELGKNRHKFFLTKLFFYVARIKKIKNFKIKNSIDVSISHNFMNNIMNILSNVNDKKIVVIHNNPFRNQGIIGKLKKMIMRIVYKRADYIVTVSNGVKEKMIETFKFPQNKVKVIYNGFDFKTIKLLSEDRLEPQYNSLFESPVIINVARLVVSKGHKHLIKSFKRVLEKRPQFKLVLIGDGPEKNNLKKLSKDLKIDNQVSFLGFNSNPYKFLTKAKLFVFPSKSEGFGMSLVESIYLNVKVIALDCDFGPREIIANIDSYKNEIDKPIYSDYGVLLPKFRSNTESNEHILTKDEENLANEIINLLSYTSGKTISDEEMVNKYSFDHIINKWLTLINE